MSTLLSSLCDIAVALTVVSDAKKRITTAENGKEAK